nr:YfiR family protein [uncultured Mucilaginibacter sp.]
MKAKERYRVTVLAIVLWLTALLCTNLADAQSKPSLEYQVEAAFLFNFTRFVQWPPSAYPSAGAPFVIAIAGNNPFGTYLDELVEGEQVEGRPIVVRRYHDTRELPACQILYINPVDLPQLKETLAQAAKQNVLTVSDADDFIKAGGMVRFFKDENRLKIAVKLDAVKAAQLDISAKLLKVAQVN